MTSGGKTREEAAQLLNSVRVLLAAHPTGT